MSGSYETALRASGPYVQLEAVEWLPEVASQETPESLLVARDAAESEAEADAREDAAVRAFAQASGELKDLLAQIPTREALALMLHLGLFEYPKTPQHEIAEVLSVRGQQVVSYMVRRARARILYLAHRPSFDCDALSRALTEKQLAVVRAVFETTSFADVARRRWPCPEGRDRKHRRMWHRKHANRIKREFFVALAEVELAGLTEQVSALRHLVENLGMLSHHAGKGSWWTAPDAEVAPESGIRLAPEAVDISSIVRRPLTDAELERVAEEMSVGPTTVLRAYAGLPVRGSASWRAARAVARLWGEA